MSFTVQEAVKKALKLRMSIAGPSGSGKTVGALRVAYGLCGDWKKIVLIDTNIDDSLAYAGDTLMGIGKFGHIPFPNPFTPKRFVEAINAAINYGAEVVIIDSASDEWAGPGGMLEMHDQVKGYNTAANWAKVNPEHLDFIKTMVEQKRAHIIATFRQKSKVAIDEVEENGHKKSTVRRLGMENIARPGTEYDFLLAVEIDRETHRADIITKRGSMLPDMRPVELTVDLGKRLLAWASSGDEGKVETRDKPTETTTTTQQPPSKFNGNGNGRPKSPIQDPIRMPEEPPVDEAGEAGTAAFDQDVNGRTHRPETETTELVYTAPLAKIGKNKYPAKWAQLLAAYTRANTYEVDGILQKLKLAQDTHPTKVIDRLNEYLDAKHGEQQPV
jgi:hypothetical protein